MSGGSACNTNKSRHVNHVDFEIPTFLVSVDMSTTFPFLKLSPKEGANGIKVLSTKPEKVNEKLGKL